MYTASSGGISVGKDFDVQTCLLTIRMEEEGISNIYIDNLMNKISKTFWGTFSIDNIPLIKNDIFSVIVNLSKQNEKGTHFIAVSSRKNRIIYFDSLGNQNIDINF